MTKLIERRKLIGLLAVIVIIVSIGFLSLSDTRQGWRVTSDGFLEYSQSAPEYQSKLIETTNGSTLYDITFKSRDAQIVGLMRLPVVASKEENSYAKIPAIVLLPGATVTKEREQGFAKYLCGLGLATLTIDQRNLGATDMDVDLQMFMKGVEPTEHKMVHDALAAAEILRSQPRIDPDKIVYIGESNGGRFAIIACALDQKARGVVAISTSGYGIDEAIASGIIKDQSMIQFYRSVDPESYLSKIPPRKLVMLHSIHDPVIPYEYANRTYQKALMPKSFYSVNCTIHGYCVDMDGPLAEELSKMIK